MTAYEKDRADTARDIQADGRATILRFPGADLKDPVTDVVTPGTPTDYPVHAIEEYKDAVSIWGSAAKAGSILEAGDRFFMVAALTDAGAVIPEPTIAAVLFLGSTSGQELAIKGVRPFQPGDIAIFYQIWARG